MFVYIYIYIYTYFYTHRVYCDPRFCWTLLAWNRWNTYLRQRKSNNIRPPCDAQAAPVICRGHGLMKSWETVWHAVVTWMLAQQFVVHNCTAFAHASGCAWIDPVLISQLPYSCGLSAECTESFSWRVVLSLRGRGKWWQMTFSAWSKEV